ncbi:hypothetical protein [Kordiimonas sp.]|uniref:hypothetical protein n=1 Tax=Kordiimonas sp. TaxID=1970157 RepID=UPI003A8F3360
MNTVKIMLTVVLLSLSGCTLEPKTSYFPTSFCCGPGDEFHNSWYAQTLDRMNEPSLFSVAQATKKNVVRFLWLRTFDQPVAFRLTFNSDGSGVLETKILIGPGEDDPGRLRHQSAQAVPAQELVNVKAALDRASHWFSDDDLPPRPLGFDGAEWVFEAILNHQYHVLARWSPGANSNNNSDPDAIIDSDFHGLGMALINLSQIDFESVY